MMLNSDFGMIYDLVLDDEFKATCNASFEGNVCTHEDGYDMALEYAEVRVSTRSISNLGWN